jgi:hypothetical protein
MINKYSLFDILLCWNSGITKNTTEKIRGGKENPKGMLRLTIFLASGKKLFFIFEWNLVCIWN